MTTEHRGHWDDPRVPIAAALLGDSPAWIRLVDPIGQTRVDQQATSAAAPQDLDISQALSPDAWRDRAGEPSAVVIDLLGVRRSHRAMADALAAAAVAHPRATFALLVAGGHLVTFTHLALRAYLIAQFTVEWIVWCESGPVNLAVIVVRPGVSSSPILRLVDGRGLELEETVSRIASCRKRQGGYTAREHVRRGVLPSNSPWTWWELSPHAEAERKDTLELGESRPFSEIAQVLTTRPRVLNPSDLEDPDALRENHVGLLQGALIGRAGAVAAPTRQVPRDAAADSGLLAEGDVVIAAVSRATLRVGVVPPGYPPATAHSSVIVVRFDPSLGRTQRAALVAFMRSVRFARSMSPDLSELNGVMRVTPRALADASVPRFGPHLLEALEECAAARRHFIQWERELEERELALFNAASFRSELPTFLARSRVAADRVTAARDVDTLDGRIRQRFPHPLALRFENIAQMDHGADRVRETLACAEHLILFLAFLGLANLGGGPEKSLQAWTAERGGLSLDWGKADTLLRGAAAEAAKLANPLAVAVPELAQLHGLFSDQRSPFNQACSELRTWRNDASHLERCTPDEVLAASDRFAGYLRILFESASMLTQTSLLEVEDYERDQLSNQPRARFAYLVGVSAAFARRWESVESEVTRKHLVLRDVHGRLHPLHPWLIRRTCEKCKHSETFALSKFNAQTAKYVAMESGHALSDLELGTALMNFVRRQTGV